MYGIEGLGEVWEQCRGEEFVVIDREAIWARGFSRFGILNQELVAHEVSG